MPEPEVEGTEAIVATEPEVTETQDPDFMALLAEAKAEGKKEAEETYKGIQRVVSTKDKEIAELKKQPPVGTPSVGLNRQIIDLMESGEYEKARGLIAVQEQESSKKATIQHQAQVTEGHRTRIRQEIVDAGHNPNDEIFEDVFDAVDLADAIDGKFERADRKLSRVLKANPKKAPEPTQSAEEKALEWIKKNNPSLLKTETGLPSTGSMSNEEYQTAYIQGKINTDDYEVEARKRGII